MGSDCTFGEQLRKRSVTGNRKFKVHIYVVFLESKLFVCTILVIPDAIYKLNLQLTFTESRSTQSEDNVLKYDSYIALLISGGDVYFLASCDCVNVRACGCV